MDWGRFCASFWLIRNKTVMTIFSEKKTEYFSKKECIDSIIDHFKKNKKAYFVEALAKWQNINGEKVSEKVIARRELISQFFGIDFVKNQKYSEAKPLEPANKEEYMMLWQAFKKHEPREVKLSTARTILNQLKQKYNDLIK